MTNAKKFPNDKSGKLFDHFREKYSLSSDRALAARIGLHPPEVSHIRNGKNVTKSHIYNMAKATGYSIKKIEGMIAEGAKE